MSKEVNSNFGYIVKLGNAYLCIYEHGILLEYSSNITLEPRHARSYDSFDAADKVAEKYGGKVVALTETQTITLEEVSTCEILK
ncbi:hypothetical protein [Listeria booriae]|uniref:Uncharacterized protein n=1 Tax=Listeria booriae TaxID=1552123 RepID=A0A7X0TNN2_9LIST|nr:hypothetical protein [Listeria booriae]MBC1331071.1 hypothetical protein [Listeria booriae]MBC2386382.1 hypothetical protein [Listeria booriae]